MQIKNRYTDNMIMEVETYADLSGANLSGANLSYANLSGANLSYANLRYANLSGADLSDAYYSISSVLLANWGELSDTFTSNLMRLDAEAIPDGTKRMNDWAFNNGPCPLEGHRYQRVAIFKELKECWKPGRPMSLWNIWKMIADEKGLKISGDKHGVQNLMVQ